MDFHKLSDRDFFIGTPEEELWQRKEIAKEVLKDMKYELKLPEEEILDYAKTRKKFEERLRERFNISQRYIKDIRTLSPCQKFWRTRPSSPPAGQKW